MTHPQLWGGISNEELDDRNKNYLIEENETEVHDGEGYYTEVTDKDEDKST